MQHLIQLIVIWFVEALLPVLAGRTVADAAVLFRAKTIRSVGAYRMSGRIASGGSSMESVR